MTDGTPPEGGTGAVDAELAKLKADLEAAKAEALREKTEREKLESIRTELETTRQAAKERERKALEEQGQFKTIAEQVQAELDKMKSEQETIKARAEAAEAQLKARDDAERAAILEAMPEADREKWKDRPLDVLRDIAPMFTEQAEAGEHKGGASRSRSLAGLKWSELTDEQRAQKGRELPVAELTKLISQG